MVRVNLVSPSKLADQHLVAEYVEILMLLGYVKKNSKVRDNQIPSSYRLGKGHITFFKDKLVYLQKRHEIIKKEMRRRGFATNKKIDLSKFDNKLRNDWAPKKEDFKIIIERLKWKINKKPNFYRYYGEKKDVKFFERLLK